MLAAVDTLRGYMREADAFTRVRDCCDSRIAAEDSALGRNPPRAPLAHGRPARIVEVGNCIVRGSILGNGPAPAAALLRPGPSDAEESAQPARPANIENGRNCTQ
jgi:hypothetical protein